MNEQPQTPDVQHDGTGLTQEQAQQVASLGTVRDTDGSGPEYVAMDADNQVGRGADGDSRARAERKEETT